MGQETISTHTLKSDAVTTVIARTTTIVSEREELVPDHGIVKAVKKTLRDYWLPSSHHPEGDDHLHHHHYQQQHTAYPSLFGSNSVMHRAYDYWKSLTEDAEKSAKEMVIKAKKARDEAAKEAKWAMFGFKREAREAYEAAEEKYRQALAAAEKVHEEAYEKARSSWFHQAASTEKDLEEEAKDTVEELTHLKWDKFKAAVDSLAFNPPKYTCSPSSQYWFSRQDPAADSGWECLEIWEYPSGHEEGFAILKPLPKKEIPLEKVHNTLAGLLAQAKLKAKNSPSITSFESTLKSVKDSYQALLDRVARNEYGAVEELDKVADKVKTRLNEAKYREEQVDAWLSSQWNAVIDNAGEYKDQYERPFKNSLKNIKKTRNNIYNSLSQGLSKSILNARNNIKDVIRLSKDEIDKSKLHRAIHDASRGFSNTLKETDAKIKATSKYAYDSAVESFNKDTSHLKARLDHAAEAARKSGSSISYHASKSISSALHGASSKYDRATASVSSIWASATGHPFVPLTRVQESYHQMLDDANTNLFGHHAHHFDRHQDANSLYGALTALYLVYLARKIWLRRNVSKARKESHGDLHLTRHGADGRRQSNSSSSSHEHHVHHEHGDKHSKHKHHDSHHKTLAKYGYTNSFGAIVTRYTSIPLLTMILLTVLELAGFTRIGLHTLFGGLFVSQLLQCGYFNNLMEQLGILDNTLGEGANKHVVREMAHGLSWTVFGLAVAANIVKVLHDEQH
ncbi:hypothetical protein FBU30_003685 [Linnemannia zychae]|nr:hypothetical protein FBU30_003685 [Linnemannia zychae]